MVFLIVEEETQNLGKLKFARIPQIIQSEVDPMEDPWSSPAQFEKGDLATLHELLEINLDTEDEFHPTFISKSI